ncbi:MAG: hypothetical protein JWQ06_1065 [Mucilaginibacter sp.]|nr:hypothetical protein [Mucilaginibacter sp.]
MTNDTVISKDLENKSLQITREFNAPIGQVWKAWTESSLLDQWWAPKPWHTETKTMDFKEGGLWLYCMVGPNSERQWCRVDFEAITPQHAFTAVDNFCDEQGNSDKSFPNMRWLTEFKETATGSKVDVTITFDKEEDIAKIIEMGFETGFTMALSNLDELLKG